MRPQAHDKSIGPKPYRTEVAKAARGLYLSIKVYEAEEDEQKEGRPVGYHRAVREEEHRCQEP